MDNVNNDIHFERDKYLVPFLLSCEDIKFLGTKRDGEIIYFRFSPKEKALQLINQYLQRTEPRIPAKTLLDKVAEFRLIIFKEKTMNSNV